MRSIKVLKFDFFFFAFSPFLGILLQKRAQAVNKKFLSDISWAKEPKVRIGKISFLDDLSTNEILDPKDIHTPKGFDLGKLTAEIQRVTKKHIF